MKIAQVAEMRDMDLAAVREYGMSEELLMENAAHGACAALGRECNLRAERFAVLCGPGNNGGDGFALARLLHSRGAQVTVVILGARDRYHGAAETNLAILSRTPVPIHEAASIEDVAAAAGPANVLVDGLFGTGLSRDVEGLYRDVISWINGAGKKILSLDIPSGIQGDSGRRMGVAVKADYTITFGLPKAGNLLYPGYAHGGRLYVTHISFPPALYDRDALTLEMNAPPALPPRDRAGHKGSFGKVLVIAGAAAYFGAPHYASLSFLKAGGGYCRLAAPRPMIPFLAGQGSEVVFVPQEETKSGSIAWANRDALLNLAEKMDIVVVGPGMSLEEETQRLIRELAAQIDKPLIVDGDGITAVSRNLDCLRRRNADTILTPHPGEMSRMTGKSIGEILSSAVETVRETANDLQASIVLKGAHSLIARPDGRVFVNSSGNPGMGSAGTGDVLTGTVAAMFCLGLPSADALRKGVYLHGLAGDLAAEHRGEDGITARDVLEHLSLALRCDRQQGSSGLEPLVV